MKLTFKTPLENLIFVLIDKIIEEDIASDNFMRECFIQFSKVPNKDQYKITIGHQAEIEFKVTREFYDMMANYFKAVHPEQADNFFLIKTKQECENDEPQP